MRKISLTFIAHICPNERYMRYNVRDINKLVAMAGRPPEPTLRYLTRQQPDTEKNKKMPNAQRKFFANAFGTFGFAPTHKANASQNQKSQANQSPPTTPNYF